MKNETRQKFSHWIESKLLNKNPTIGYKNKIIKWRNISWLNLLKELHMKIKLSNGNRNIRFKWIRANFFYTSICMLDFDKHLFLAANVSSNYDMLLGFYLFMIFFFVNNSQGDMSAIHAST